MNIEEIRTYSLSKPYATEDMPFGPGYVVFRIGGKIFGCLALVLGHVVKLKWSQDEFDEVIDKYPFVLRHGVISRKYTPEDITYLNADDIFVLGSNLEGMHMGCFPYICRHCN